ncbi:DNA-binding transcriptional regulator, Lrp family [Halanaeroarchaeum sp. HSR-CO]|uniref:Lrp/AsnC family transcriptional regulator n=1 Tax=Halanaeroarchaeum sp. HSR-CO TaxID=2866382 RepID=UPI00217E385F|nr:Lrp/AsnC family transcriptional regulator [Halanaeroarchaeum sp. HSR-CO]UWG49012.1 DNA-binding transcriptional regulator, Lrp family [Halanaeroarchaeum sp. HSR-CO]
MSEKSEVDLDDKDLNILAAIGRLKTSNSQKIHEATGIPNSTVHYRIQQLRETGVLKNDLFELDLEKVGLPVTVITEVFAVFGEDYHRTIGERLGQIESVNQVYFTMGDTDFVLISHHHDRASVTQFVEDLERVEGIERTSSKFVIEPVKYAGFPIGDYSFQTLQDTLSDTE